MPLYWAQAADDVKGLSAQPADVRGKVLKGLLRTWNVHHTANMHTLLPLYVGQRVRLTGKPSAPNGLVQDAPGTVLAIITDPADKLQRSGERDADILLSHAVTGVWVRFDRCTFIGAF